MSNKSNDQSDLFQPGQQVAKLTNVAFATRSGKGAR